ncbi:MAG: response regulator [Nitrospirae bacterium]|nr:response regulator [Nitrospirota bacterium]
MAIKLLIVDDEKSFADTLSQRLELRGFNVSVAYGGEEAIESIESGSFDVCLLDVKMPGMSGIDVLRWAKEHYPGLVVVMLTGYSSETDDQEAHRIGLYAFLRKPPDFNELVRTLRSACDAGKMG